MRKLSLMVLSALLGAVAVADGNGRNLFFNSGFELGDAGFGIKKYLRLETNPGLKYEPPVVDTKTFVSGKQSIRVPNRFAEELEFYTREVKLEPGRDYTLSLWMKCEVDRLPVALWLRANDWRGPQRTFVVGKTWQRHVFSFKADPDKRREYYHLSVWFGRPADTPPTDLWLDDLQLVRGGEAPYQPGAELELALSSPPVYVSNDGTVSAMVACVAFNNSDKPIKAQVTLDTLDDYRKTKVATQTFAVDLPPRGSQSFERGVELGKYGVYVVEASAVGVASQGCYPAYFAVVGDAGGKRVDLDKTFCVGVNCGGGATGDARIKPGMQTWGVDPEEHVKRLSLSGCRLLRDWDSAGPAFAWRTVEPEQGKTDYRWPDWCLDACERNGMRILPVLGGADFAYNTAAYSKGGWPKWVRDQSAKRPTLNGKTGEIVNLPPLPLWRKYIHNVAERYKGRISHYEITNEPNLYLTPEEYRTYLKAASEELRATDPDCEVVGFCVTGDTFGKGKTREFLEPAFADGGLAAADIVSFHPYDSRQLSSPNAADAQIEVYRQLLKENGAPDKPLWDSELYYLYDGSNGKDYPAHYAATRSLIDLGEGVKQSITVPLAALWRRLLIPHADEHVYLGLEALPSETFVAYNALARHFEGASPVAKLKWPLDCACYVYEKEGRYVAAFWKYGCLQGTTVSLPFSGQDVQLYDLFGNQLPWDGQPLKLDAAPYYLELREPAFLEKLNPLSGALGKEDFVAALREARLDSTQKVVVEKLRPQFSVPVEQGGLVVEKLCPLFSGDGGVVMAGLRNGTSRKISGDLELSLDRGAALGKAAFQLEPYEDKVVKVPAKFPPLQGGVTVKALARVEGQTWDWLFPLDIYPAKSSNGPVIPLRKMGRGWHLQHAVAAAFQARHDDRNLYLDIQVEDSTSSGAPEGREPWNQDCVELFFDPRPAELPLPLKTAGEYHGQVKRFFVVPHAPEGRQFSAMPGEPVPPGAQVKTSVTPTGYIVKLAIPCEALGLKPPLQGKELGFELGVDDGVGKEAAAPIQLTWSSWGDHYKNRLSFGLVKFE